MITRTIENQNTANSSKHWVDRLKYNRLIVKNAERKRAVFTHITFGAESFERTYGVYLSEPDRRMA